MNPSLISKLRKYIVLPAVAVLVMATAATANAQVLYEKKNQEVVSAGITYENSIQVTIKGLIDVHVLYVDIANPNIEIKPIQSKNSFGAKETVSQMTAENGAIAGVNADFFDMALSPASPFGTVIVDGKVISTEEERPGYTTFFLDKDNNPFIEYIEPDIIFKNNGVSNIKVHAMNKYLRDFSAIYFDRNAITNTAELDAKFPDLVKFVVTDGMITYISKGSETVEVPENGYIIVCAATYAQYFYDSVKVGHTAEISIEARFDYNNIKSAIGGAGKMLENGNYSNYGYVVSPTSRQPRTAIGISQDNTKLILAVVDGRSYSVGATHEEMAEIMKSLGAWNAMHLDGGGSSTLVADTNDNNGLTAQNTPSEGSQRKVINGLGVFNTAPIGEAVSLNLNVSSERVFFGNPVTLNVTGLDANSRKTVLPEDSVIYYSDDQAGTWQGNVFYPSQVGKFKIYAIYKDFTGEKIIENMALAQILPSRESLKMVSGEKAALTFEGISTTGVSSGISKVNFEVVPADIGTITPEGVFAAGNGTTGYIKCYIGEIASYIDVSIGTKTDWVSTFKDTSQPLEFLSSGESVKGSVAYSDKPNGAGNNAVGLTYSFAASESTQAAYLKFSTPLIFKDNLSAIQLSAYGHGQGGWLRAKLVDALGNDYLVDIAKDIDFSGWSRFTVQVPAEAKHPVTLERLYVAALKNTDISTKTVYFDDIAGLYAADYGSVDKPASNIYVNPYKASVSNQPPQGALDFTFVGKTMLEPKDKLPADYKDVQAKAIKNFTTNATPVFIGKTDIEGVNARKWSAGYKFDQIANFALIEISAAKGGLASTSPYNWSFVNEAKNSTADHIIILMDREPSNLASWKEYELFRNALAEVQDSGKTIFVISASTGDSDSKIIDGINYINLGDLYNQDETVNQSFKILRMRINGQSISFELQNAF